MSYLEIARQALTRHESTGQEVRIKRIKRKKARCCPVCDARARRPDPLGDGCQSHGVTEGDVAERWERAWSQGADPAVCLCCAGPTLNVRALVCKQCEDGRGPE